MLTRLVGSILLAVLLVGASLADAGPPATPSPTAAVTVSAVTVSTEQVAATSTSSEAYEARILTLVNRQRATHGMGSLRPLSCADHYAEAWATHMARTNSMYHQSLLPLVRQCQARAAGENIAMGNLSADRMMAMWMASRGHRRNILNHDFTHIGIGAARTSTGRWYGTQDFAGR